MKLSSEIIKKIENLLEPGFTIELRLEQGDPLPKEGGGTVPRPLQATVFKRPDQEQDIKIVPTLCDQDSPTTLTLSISKLGQDPVAIASIDLPKGYYVAGLKGYSLKG